MASEHSRTELLVDNDARLICGLGRIVEPLGLRLGMPAARLQDLAEAAEKICLATFPLIGNHNASVKASCQDFPDRIEVTLEYPGDARAKTVQSVKAAGRVDRVQEQSSAGHTRILLVQFLSHESAKS